MNTHLGNLLCAHPRSRAESRTSIIGILSTKLLLDPQKLVVLGQPLRTARRSSLDLSGAQPHGQVCDVRILRLPAPMARHDAPAGLLGLLHGIDGLRDGPYLIHLEQQTCARLLVNRAINLFNVCHRQIVTDNLECRLILRGELGPVFPVILVERVLNCNDGVVRRKTLVEVAQLRSGNDVPIVLEVEVILVLALHAKLGRGDV
mmetsp:Transcript_4815/g.12106  ORF Transcript_4815/g.12106 Transcript_4815/m.12106 type:complete len:204 (-) Transcript_4815:866-1477(-)